MKKHSKVLILSILLFLLAFPIHVYAHSGRTDGNGGHTNRSTGEYHYHHGYPAHDHYDMDGDGDLDCPYTFKGQYHQEVNKVPSWIYWIIGILILLITWLFFTLRKKNEEISNLRNDLKYKLDSSRDWFKAIVRKRYTQAIEDVKKDRQKLLKSLPPDTKVDFRDPFPFSLFEEFDNSDCPFILPDGVSITKNGYPALGYVDDDFPYGKYTVYITPSGNCYHKSRYCKYVTLASAVCVLSAMRTKKPCACCTRRKAKPVPQWYLNFLAASRSLDISWDDNKQ